MVLVGVAVGRVHLVDGDGMMVVLHLRLLLWLLLRLAAVIEQILLLWMLLLLWCSSILLLWRRLHFVGVLVMLLRVARVARTCVDTEMKLQMVGLSH